MAANWLQNRLIPNELLDPVLFFRSVVVTHSQSEFYYSENSNDAVKNNENADE